MWACCRGAWRALCTVHSALVANTQEHVAGERGEHCVLCTVHLLPILKNMLQGSVESTVYCALSLGANTQEHVAGERGEHCALCTVHLVPLLKNMLQGSAESTVHCAQCTWCHYSRTCCRGAWRALCTVTWCHYSRTCCRGARRALCTVHCHFVPILKNRLNINT